MNKDSFNAEYKLFTFNYKMFLKSATGNHIANQFKYYNLSLNDFCDQNNCDRRLKNLQ